MISTSNVPKEFLIEAEHSVKRRDRAHLILQQLELEGLPWQAAGEKVIAKCLAEANATGHADRVILFTGHRIDSPDRNSARFPPEAESIARHAITNVLQNEAAKGPFIGIAGGANGGDILFLEACRVLGLPFKMLLALPETKFIAASVQAPNTNWVERFHALAQESKPDTLADAPELPSWLKGKPHYNFWARNNLWLISVALTLKPKDFLLLALWDGQQGDGVGGTEDMVNTARRLGARFIHLDTGHLFADVETIRTARP